MLIDRIQLFLNSVCNLNCSFCYLDNVDNKEVYNILNQNIKEAWLTNQYITNIKKLFTTIEADPKDVRFISFWGGEPLLGLGNLKNSISELLDFFNNLDTIFISTNFKDTVNLFPFLLLLDSKIDHKITVQIQISIDAKNKDLREYGHKVDWATYYNNLYNLIDNIKQNNGFQYINILIHPHSVLPDNVIYDNLSTTKQIDQFFNDFSSFLQEINQYIDNNKLNNWIKITTFFVYPTIADPHLSSIQDGINIYNISKNINLLNISKKLNLNNEFFRNFLYDYDDLNIFNYTADCASNGLNGLSILPDGTICSCFLDYILESKEYWNYITNNPLLRQKYRESCYKKKLYFNPLKSSQKEIDEYNWYYYDSTKLSISTNSSIMLNLALELAKSGQIDTYYFYNYNTLFNHLLEFNHMIKCTIDKINTTHTTHCIPVDELRHTLNGLAIYYNNKNKLLERNSIE